MRVFFVILTLSIATPAFSQEENAIKQTINNLFEGMRKSDTALIRSAFAPGPILQTVVRPKEGKVRIMSEPLDSFLVSVGHPHTEVYDERISFEMIKIDGDLATVWTPFKFYLGDKFSHCGVNSFQLVRLDGQWKIQYLIDTRRKKECE